MAKLSPMITTVLPIVFGVICLAGGAWKVWLDDGPDDFGQTSSLATKITASAWLGGALAILIAAVIIGLRRIRRK